MADRRSARFALRDATADAHARVDAVFSRFDLTDAASYGDFLRAQAAAHLPAERALEDGGVAAVVPDWPERRRAPLLLGDIEALGLAVPSGDAVPALAGTPSLLGALYVLEGSRLGGALLRRKVPSSLPTAFLSANRPAAWRDLVSLLDARLTTPKDISVAITAACDVFALFERSGRRVD